ncbi:class I SAM-dependent methyltransferase [Aquibium sp. A9E412]|uniref:class I SAM-dependent methyltransferase n=1 Tax=Aquibium sp. A9E412 TaxID=2976767 RepID=UPI0025B07F34|nr:class I SAM-dependent methyltransferase [Aquibium sp. A9E412]MDN2567963.1 class I SAM-dependent methyltransferase [Aquibium sp. A9E412]
MTALADRIARLIAAGGPLSVADYMALCLADPEHGYYMTREPFGTAGDFTTAPEVSQMFGELVGVWLYAAWQADGRPAAPVIAEIGPGRGTLMKDVLRTLARLDPALIEAARFALVETSPRLVAVQRATLAGAAATPQWVATPAALPAGPLFLVGNELFDALPVRQYVKTGAGWRERVVALDEAGALCFRAGPGAPDPALLPPGAAAAPPGAIAEIAPARSALMAAIAERIAAAGGAALFFDYGHLEPGLGDTLQALREHAHDDPLAHPGAADLTAHVDFAALAAEACRAGLEARLMSQADFLLGMGLAERAGRLGAGRTPDEQARLAGEVERLAGAAAMGTLFKALIVHRPGRVLAP